MRPFDHREAETANSAESGPTRRAVLRAGLSAVGALAVGCSRPPAPSPLSAEPSPPPRPLEVAGDASEGQAEASAEAETTTDAGADATSGPDGPSRPLLRRYAGLAASLPWIDLGGLPTPVSRVDALGERLGLTDLRVKGDDLAGEVYGGSKARKLEHLLADALGREADGVLTFGGVGSNHALATAIHARRHGLGCVLMLLPEPPSEHARVHLLAEQRVGCELVRATGADVRDVDAALARRSDRDGLDVIPMGGTTPLGNAGYVNAAFELAEQCAEGLLPVPDVIYVALGTCGTAAGLYVGLRAAELPTRLVAVRASNPGMGSMRHLGFQIEATASYLHGLDPSFPEVEADASLLHLEHGFAGAGYAIPTEAGARAATLAAELAGVELDSTYTAKAFAALVHDAPRLAGQSVLFWNTYDARPVSTEGVSPSDLPPPLRGYVGSHRSSTRTRP